VNCREPPELMQVQAILKNETVAIGSLLSQSEVAADSVDSVGRE